MDKKTSILSIIIFILVLLLFIKCKPEEEYGIQKEVYRDSIITTWIDTIEFEKVITETKTIIDTVHILEQQDGTFLYKYITDINDSLIEGKIITEITDSMEILSQSIEYTPKFPKYIHQIDSVIIKDSIVITLTKPNKLDFLIGGNLLYNETPDLIPTLAIQLKNESIYEVGYSPFSKTIQIGLKLKISRNERSLHFR